MKYACIKALRLNGEAVGAFEDTEADGDAAGFGEQLLTGEGLLEEAGVSVLSIVGVSSSEMLASLIGDGIKGGLPNRGEGRMDIIM